jgi:hypothetical protein
MSLVRIENPVTGEYHKWAEGAQKLLVSYGYDVQIVPTHGFPNWEVKGTEDQMNNAGIFLSILLDIHELAANGANKAYRL